MTIGDKIVEWAEDKDIFKKATPKDQFVKMVEEIGEIAECLSKGKSEDELALEIGDLYVTAVLLANMHGFSLDDCAWLAYNKIANRTGAMVNGVFIKSGDYGLVVKGGD